MKEQYNFKECVLDHLPSAFEMAMMSLEDETVAYMILDEVINEYIITLATNLRKIQGQRNWDYKRVTEDTGSKKRKAAGRRKYYPTGGALFQYMVKEKIALEELKQEVLGISVGRQAKLARYFGNLFRNDNILGGAFSPIAAVFGILYNLNPHTLVKISAHIHGISEEFDTRHRDYRDHRFFTKIGAKLIADSVERFREPTFFNIVPINEQPHLHSDLKESLADGLAECIEFEKPDEATAELVRTILGLHRPWGVPPLQPTDLPNLNPTYNAIPGFVVRDVDDEDKFEALRSASAMDHTFAQAFLEIELARRNDMEENFYIPVINQDGGKRSKKPEPIPDISPEFVLGAATKYASRPMRLRQLTDFTLVVKADDEEIGLFDPHDRVGKIVVPVGARKLTFVAQTISNFCARASVAIASVPIALTGLDEGESWDDEVVLENGFHIGLRLAPSHSSSESMALSIDYHRVTECCYELPQSVFKRAVSGLAESASRFFGGVVSPMIEEFLYNIQSADLYSEPRAKNSGLKNSLAFSLTVSVVTILLIFGFHLFSDRLPIFLLVPNLIMMITMVFVTIFFIISFMYLKKDGVNKVFSSCSQFSFLSGVVCLVLVTSIFSHRGVKPDLASSEAPSSTPPVAPVNDKPEPVVNPLLLSRINSSLAATAIASREGTPLAAAFNKQSKKSISEDPRGGFQYISRTINRDDCEVGASVKAYFEKRYDAGKPILNKANEVNPVDEVNAKITLVVRPTAAGNRDILLILRVQSLTSASGDKGAQGGNEYLIALNSDQNQIALVFKNDGEFWYAKALEQGGSTAPKDPKANLPQAGTAVTEPSKEANLESPVKEDEGPSRGKRMGS